MPSLLYSPGVFDAPDERVIGVPPGNLRDDLARHTGREEAGGGFIVEARLLGAGCLRTEILNCGRKGNAAEADGIRRCSGCDGRRRKIIGDPETYVVSGCGTCGLAVEAEQYGAAETVSAVAYRAHAGPQQEDCL